MKVVSLISGGKDSCYNMMQCVAEGHDLVALANLRPRQENSKDEANQACRSSDELDSYMYQTVGHHAINLYAEAMGLPLYRGYIDGSSREQGSHYSPTDGDEVEDLYKLLAKVKNDLGVEGVAVGAILSNYQRVRVENVCSRLGLTPLAFLWRRDQDELLQEMITAGVEAIIIKVAAMGLTSVHLKKTLQEIQPHMISMKEKYQLNICGEGGEFETFTLDCPLFAKRMRLKHYEMINHSDDAFAPVHYLNLLDMELEAKQNVAETFAERLKQVPMKRGVDIHRELEELMVPVSAKDDVLPSDDDGIARLDPRSDTPNADRLPPNFKSSREGYLWISGIRAMQSDICMITESTQLAMESLKELLDDHGYSLSDVVLVHVYVRDMSNFPKINSVYRRYFQQNPPARVCVEVSLGPNVALQIDCLAHRIPDCIQIARVHRHTMHVQSVSHWAPANIGPYSQAVQIGNLIFTAGTIGLCPSTMTGIEGGITPQCALSLRSLKRVLAAMGSGVSLNDVIGGVCYVTDVRHVNVAEQHWEKFISNFEENCQTVASQSKMMSYVIVPRLPKDVLVEWQVVAFTGSDSLQYSSQTAKWQVSSTELKVIFHSELSLGFIICNVTPNSDPLHPEDTVRDLVTAVDACLKGQMQSWSSALCVRVFYRQAWVGYGQLSKALMSELQKASATCPAVCLVPVLSLPGSHIITAQVFLQR